MYYVEAAVRLFPDLEPPVSEVNDVSHFEATILFEKTSVRLRCKLCGQSAAYLVPQGLMCEEHAWQAAARINWGDSDPWVPIPTTRSIA